MNLEYNAIVARKSNCNNVPVPLNYSQMHVKHAFHNKQDTLFICIPTGSDEKCRYARDDERFCRNPFLLTSNKKI